LTSLTLYLKNSMTTIRNKFAILLILLWAATGCIKEIGSEEEYYKWISDPEHELVRTKKAGEVEISVRYLSPRFLAYKEWKGLDNKTDIKLDSLVDSYANSLTFLMSISNRAQEDKKADIMYEGLESFEGYNSRVHEMNFNFQNYLLLQQGQSKVEPSICVMENSYGLSKVKKIYIVFPAKHEDKELLHKQELDIVYVDEIFNTGINHFLFSSSAINKANQIKFRHN
jgi:hypothetical protein